MIPAIFGAGAGLVSAVESVQRMGLNVVRLETASSPTLTDEVRLQQAMENLPSDSWRSVADYLRGHAVEPGDRFQDL